MTNGPTIGFMCMALLLGSVMRSQAATLIPFPDNDREFIIDYTFGGKKESKHWRLVQGKDCRTAEWTRGYTPVAFWRPAAPGAELTLRRKVTADLSEFAFLRIRAMASTSQTVTMMATIDGKRVQVGDTERGKDGYSEFVGPVEGKTLQSLDVIFAAADMGPQSSAVMWVMLVKPGAPTPLEKLDPAWPGLLVDADAPIDPKPVVGLMFDEAELEDLRVLLASPAHADAWKERVARAEQTMMKNPEEAVSSFCPGPTRRFGRDHIPVKQIRGSDVLNMAYVGLVEKRPDMLRVAARWALTMTRCKRWVVYGLEVLPGVTFSHGRFAQSGYAYNMALVLDWAGSVLTDEGQKLVARAIHEKGVLDIDGIMHPGSYVWGCNQGLVFEKGRFAGAAATRKWYPDEFERRKNDAQKMLKTCLQSCIYPDGTGKEGPAYWHYTVNQVPALVYMLSRTSGKPVKRIIPREMVTSAKWAWINRRTDTDEFRMLTYSSSGYERGLSNELALLFAGLLQVPQYAPLARERVNKGTDPLFLQLAKSVPANDVPVPPAKTMTRFADSGQVDVRQPDPRNGMRFYFLSGDWTGKSHSDRNSFILEAFGETLLLDRATAHYTHPLHATMIRAEGHNTVVPDERDQGQRPHGPAAKLIRCEEQDPLVVIESDAAQAWQGTGQKVLRRLIHLRPATLVVEDLVRWKEPYVTHQYWQSHGEWKKTPDGWVATVGDVQLCATVVRGDVDVAAAVYGIDGMERPVHRLDVALPKSEKGRIITVLRARKGKDFPWPCQVKYNAEQDMLTLDRPGGAPRTIHWTGYGSAVSVE